MEIAVIRIINHKQPNKEVTENNEINETNKTNNVEFKNKKISRIKLFDRTTCNFVEYIYDKETWTQRKVRTFNKLGTAPL